MLRSLANRPEIRALVGLADGPRTGAQVAETLRIEVDEAEARLTRASEWGYVDRVVLDGEVVYAPNDRARSTGENLRAIGRKMFGPDEVHDATWVEWLRAAGTEPPAETTSSESAMADFARDWFGTPVRVPEEFAVLPSLRGGAATAEKVAADLDLPLERAAEMLEWCSDCGAARRRPSALGTRYALTKRGRKWVEGPETLQLAEVVGLHDRQARFAAAREDVDRRHDRIERGPGRWIRLVLAVVLGVDGILRVITGNNALLGALMVALGLFVYTAARRSDARQRG